MKSIYERYHIKAKDTPSKIKLPPKFTVKRLNNCVNVQECTQACIYEVHKTQEDGQMAEPFQDLCRGCFQCFLTCPKNAISIGINPEFEKLGNSYFTPDRIKTIYFEAETGRVPVSGTGYRGPFAGKGFDSMWFDFSEIVRPTRDGIHGREYISTSVDIGRKLLHLQFDENGNLLSNSTATIEIPIPIIFEAPLTSGTAGNIQLALAKAATRLHTFTIVNAEEYTEDLIPYKSNLIPRIDSDRIEEFEALIKISRIVELNFGDREIGTFLEKIKTSNPSVLVSLRFPYDERSGERAKALAKQGIDIIHFYVGDELVEKNPDVIKNAIRSVHSCLVESGIRDEITIISSGGIAEAAHVPKSIILGADVVSVGLSYQIALGCKVCYGNNHAIHCPIKVESEDIEWATQRIINLIGSWRDQLLEVLGGMGLREVRRQRGEIGRAMFYEDLDAKIFGDRE
jgi:NAD-dependent dihydropyrimidine dehydrogenase PreA subunit